MLSFLTFHQAPEQIEIIADEKGLDELIAYLKFIKESKDHMHLIIDNELDGYPMSLLQKEKLLQIKHVRIEFSV